LNPGGAVSLTPGFSLVTAVTTVSTFSPRQNKSFSLFRDIESENGTTISVRLQIVTEIASFHCRNQKCLNFKDNPAA
jgi:hypothetical protein